MKIKSTVSQLLLMLMILFSSWSQAAVEPPRMYIQNRTNGLSVARLADGSFAFYNRFNPAGGPLVMTDKNGQPYTFLPWLPESVVQSPAIMNSKVLVNNQVILSRDNKVTGIFTKGSGRVDRETAKKIGMSMYIDNWMIQADPSGSSEPRMIQRCHNGSLMEYEQLPSGRIILPFGDMQPFAKAGPPNGRFLVVVSYSDDQGATWKEGVPKLSAPCYPGYNGSSEGLCEPAIERLKDGRLWMLMRTATGFLYQSYSADEGATWSNASASRFSSSTGPAHIMRLKDGALVVIWNNCEMPLRFEGQGVYGGRDALHMAVSYDDGRTWRGFREVYLDFLRNASSKETGDHGTAYPYGGYTADGKIAFVSGQGAGGRNAFIVDPLWITATNAQTDFSDGLEQWSVYKHFGPAVKWWRARTGGGQLVPDPSGTGGKCLQLRKADELIGDCGVWNFPNGWKGTLITRIMMLKGCRGAAICLNDRFFDPSEKTGQDFAVFKIAIEPDGKIGSAQLTPDKWHDLALKWDLTEKKCQLTVNGQAAGEVKITSETLNGVSYVRFCSTAQEIDQSGFLVGRVSVSIEDPYAPACQSEDLLAHEKRYIEKMVPLWSGDAE